MDQGVADQGLERVNASPESGQGLSGLPVSGPAQGAAPALEGQVLIARQQRPRGRPMGYLMPEEWRARLQTAQAMSLLHRVIARDKRLMAMHPAQLANCITSARVILAKSIPDLAAVQVVSQAEQVVRITTRME